MKLISHVLSTVEYARNARAFLRDPVTIEDARRDISARVAGRERSFLRVVREGIFARPENVYARLLQYAGVGEDDFSRLVEQNGVEGALERLYDAGVYLTVSEMKGREPVTRGSLQIQVKASDLDNPFRSGHAFTMISSGSTGRSTSAGVDFNYARDESVYLLATMAAHGVEDWPAAHLSVPLPAPLYYAKIGRPMEKFFSVADTGRWSSPQSLGLLRAKLTVMATQVARRRASNPEFSFHDQTARATEWLAEKKERGTPAVLALFASPAVRVCLHAAKNGLDISGSVMRVAGEPTTPAKAKIMANAGVKAIVVYVSVETGVIGVSCATPGAVDDVHFFSDRIAAIQRPKKLGSDAVPGGLVYSNVGFNGPRLLLNVESGDYAEMERRECGCLLGGLGLKTHLSVIRSYEKLTSEGVTFLGTSLHRLLEEVLPQRFGGTGLDYQLSEEEHEGQTKAEIVVSPRVGAVDERALVAAVVETLRAEQPYWTGIWMQNDTLRVIRREPAATATTKVLPLHRVASQAAVV